MTFLPSVNGSSGIQKADGNGGFKNAVSGVDYVSPAAFYNNNATATLTNYAGPAVSLLPLGTTTHTIAANSVSAGSMFMLSGGGIYTTPGSTTSITLSIKIGSTALCSVTTSAFLNGVTNFGFDFEGWLKILATGSSGSVIAGGSITYKTAATTTIDWLSMTAPATIDFTSSQLLDLVGTWDAASTTRSATVQYANITQTN